jgi:homocysteine S-methyltransferase
MSTWIGETPLLADGAMGTRLLAMGWPAGGCLEEAIFTRPELVRQVHADYLAAGSRLLLTHTFGANRARLQAFGLAERTAAINRQATALLKETIGGRARIGGDIGPAGLKPGECTPGELTAIFVEQALALAAAGVEAFFLETFTNVAEIGLAIAACRQAAPDLPVIACVSPAKNGSLADGSRLEAWAWVLDQQADALGVNCYFGPEEAAGLIARLRALSRKPLVLKPNAGLPSALSPADFARTLAHSIAAGARIVGGCCGTGPEHIRALGLTFFDADG